MKSIFMLPLVLLALLSGCSIDTSSSQPEQKNLISPVEVVNDSGTGAKLSSDFILSRNCSNGTLAYNGNQIKSRVDTAWVNFRIYDITIADYAVENSGVHELMPTGSGSTRVNLGPGTYYVEVESFNAAWQYSITCR